MSCGGATEGEYCTVTKKALGIENFELVEDSDHSHALL
jgi:hypothetical protein